MQILHVEGFEQRILYNAAKAYSIQLESGENYPALQPVIALTIADFRMFPEIEDIITRFILTERNYLIDYPVGDLELVFIELPKFEKSLNELSTLTEKWIYFLNNARKLNEIPPTMSNVAEIEQAFVMANKAGLSPEELDELEHQVMFIQDQRGAITSARREGREEGREETRLAIARQLLAKLSDAEIAQLTQLPIDPVHLPLEPFGLTDQLDSVGVQRDC
jgi:predicted transposase/invertase (TIGR01784 family)